MGTKCIKKAIFRYKMAFFSKWYLLSESNQLVLIGQTMTSFFKALACFSYHDPNYLASLTYFLGGSSDTQFLCTQPNDLIPVRSFSVSQRLCMITSWCNSSFCPLRFTTRIAIDHSTSDLAVNFAVLSFCP